MTTGLSVFIPLSVRNLGGAISRGLQLPQRSSNLNVFCRMGTHVSRHFSFRMLFVSPVGFSYMNRFNQLEKEV